MARRKKGQKVDGWVILDKPVGLTSTAAVGKVRRAFDAQKAGHAGTLDPAATGLLAIALGEATKTIPFVTDAEKAYRFTIRIGEATDTDDAEGTIIQTTDHRPSDEDIRNALPAFRGEIQQIPPRYSAVKVDGARAYDLARDDEEFALKSRPLWVERLDLIDRPDADTAILEMECGKGGYVRAIARDLGQALGTCAHVTALRRLWSGPFDLEDAVPSIEALDADPNVHLRPVSDALIDIPSYPCPPEAAARLRNGNPAPVTRGFDYGETIWAEADGQPVAIGTYRAGQLYPTRVFNL